MEMTRQNLEKLYRESNNKKLAKELKISQVTLLLLLAKHGIELKGKGNRTPRKAVKIVA